MCYCKAVKVCERTDKHVLCVFYTLWEVNLSFPVIIFLTFHWRNLEKIKF